MKSKKTILCGFGLSLAAISAIALAGGTKLGYFKSISVADNGVWNHYSENQGTEVSIGNKEYWIQCGTNEISFVEPTGTKEEKSEAPDTSSYEYHDARYTDNPKEYVFDKATNLVGASVDNVTDSDDYTWGMETPNSKSLKYKSYVGKVFKNKLPLVNFNYYDEVSMDLKTTIYNDGYKIGFDADVSTTGYAPEISVKDGGHVYLYRLNSETVRMIIDHPKANTYLTHDFVGESYVTGQESVYFYTVAGGDAYFEVSNWAPVYSHVHNMEEYESETKIAAVTNRCSACGYSEVLAAPELEFTIFRYGASAYNITEDSDWPSQIMVVTSDKISYKSYSTDLVFRLTLPRIDFRDFKNVNITVSSTNWVELVGLGFTQAQAESKENHTRYGGAKENGSLSFSWEGNAVKVQFVFEYLTMSTTITDKDVIEGNKGFDLYQTTYYDRYLDFSNFQLTLKD